MEKFSCSENSKNEKASEVERYRIGKKTEIQERLSKYERILLLTRGVKGLYIYAVDQRFQEELMRRQGEKK